MTVNTARGVASVFDPLRLRVARHAAMITKKDLAAVVGVTPAALSHYENGTHSPSPKVAAALALGLGVPVGFFAADRPLGEAPRATPHFRSLRSTSQQERDKAFAHALLTWEVAGVLERTVRLPESVLPPDRAVEADEPIAAAVRAARATREFFGLGAGPIPNVVRLLESRGVVCTRLPALSARVYAFSCSFPGRPVVVLSSGRDHLAAGRFDAAHELGHLVMHHDEDPGSHAVERQAHAFAAELLAPADEIIDELPRRADWSAYLDLKRVWGMSIQALLFRARELGVMPEHVYRRAVTEISARRWRTSEPGDDDPAESPRLLAKALDVAGRRGIGVDEIADGARLRADLVAQIACLDDRPTVEV